MVPSILTKDPLKKHQFSERQDAYTTCRECTRTNWRAESAHTVGGCCVHRHFVRVLSHARMAARHYLHTYSADVQALRSTLAARIQPASR